MLSSRIIVSDGHELRGEYQAVDEAEWRSFTSLHFERSLPGLRAERQRALGRELRAHPWSVSAPLLVHERSGVAFLATPSQTSFANLWAMLARGEAQQWTFGSGAARSGGWQVLKQPELALSGPISTAPLRVGRAHLRWTAAALGAKIRLQAHTRYLNLDAQGSGLHAWSEDDGPLVLGDCPAEALLSALEGRPVEVLISPVS